MGGIWKPAGRARYRIWYKDHTGRRRTSPGYKDKQASQAKLAKLERNSERRAEGLPVPDDRTGLLPLPELIERHLADMKRQGVGPEHLAGRRGFLERLSAWEGWQLLRDVQHGPMLDALARLAEKGRSDQTLESYRHNWKAFLEWCLDGRLLEVNPVARVKGVRKKRPRRPKRAPTIEEWWRLLDVNPKRRDVYFVAGLTGLRCKELRRLERRDVDLEALVFRLRPEAQKGKRPETVPLLPDVIPTLQRLCEERSPLDRLLSVPSKETVVKDVAAAGIVSPDAEGRHVTMHSLRYFFCTLLAGTLPIQTVRLLMRHRDISVTCKVYLDLGIADVAQQLQQLPSVLTRPPAHPDGDAKS